MLCLGLFVLSFQNEDEQSFQDEAFVPAPRRRGRGRGRGRGRPRVVEAQGIEPEPANEPVVPEVDPAVFAAGMAGINQGLAALNQAMPLVQQMLQQKEPGNVRCRGSYFVYSSW